MGIHNVAYDLLLAPFKGEDPGDGGTILYDVWNCQIPLASGSTSETRTLLRAINHSVSLVLVMVTDGGGDIVVTVTGGYNSAGDTEITFNNAGDSVRLYSVEYGGVMYWRVASNNQCDLGNARYRLDATVWDDLRVPATSTTRGGSKDPGFAVAFTNGSGSQGVFVEWFDKTSEEEKYFTCQMPHSWAVGTDIYPHVHWIPKTNGGAGHNVCWGLEYTWANLGGTFGDTSIIYGDVTSVDETLVAGRMYLTPLTTISGAGKTLSSMLLCRIFRDATGAGGTDDYDDDAGFIEMDFHIELGGIGSDNRFSED